MIITFTHDYENIANESVQQAKSSPQKQEPSQHSIDRILNFSKNLEVKPSKLLTNFEFLKS